MGKKNKLWSKEELILAINLYFKTPFGKIHNRNPQIIKLAKYLNRTPSAVSWKLVNFASLDPSLKKRGIKGAYHTSKLDKEIWNEFFKNIEELSFKSEIIFEEITNSKNIKEFENDFRYLNKSAEDKKAYIKVRTNQNFFRSTVLASYNNKCCITGIEVEDFLIASHIIPWKTDKTNRLNPHNGLCLNSLHDKAFDKGYITIDTDYKIILSKRLKKSLLDKTKDFFLKYENKKINLPDRFLPEIKFLQYHNEKIFED